MAEKWTMTAFRRKYMRIPSDRRPQLEREVCPGWVALRVRIPVRWAHEATREAPSFVPVLKEALYYNDGWTVAQATSEFLWLADRLLSSHFGIGFGLGAEAAR